MSDDRDLLAEIHETTLALLQMSSLPLPSHLHLGGLRGGLEAIRDKTEAAYRAVTGDFEDEE